MLHLYTGHTEDLITLTLAETTTIEGASYLMVVAPVMNGEAIRFLLPTPIEEKRANTYQINTSELFSEAGEHRYAVYEQAGESLDETGLTEVENGILWVHRTGPTVNAYETPTDYKAYR